MRKNRKAVEMSSKISKNCEKNEKPWKCQKPSKITKTKL